MMGLRESALKGARAAAKWSLVCITLPLSVPFGLFLLCTGSTGKCGTPAIKKARKKRIDKAWKVRQKNQPRPLPSRRRDLSSIREQGPSGVASSRSALLRLPLELRQQIFTEVLGRGTIHLIQLRGRLGHVRCTRQPGQSTDGLCIDPARECFPKGTVQTYHRCDLTEPPLSTDTCIALLQVCRQTYREAAQILYETNTFDINHPTTLLFLAITITPQRLQSIQNLQLTWIDPSIRRSIARPNHDKYPDDLGTWNRMWTHVGNEMTGLRKVNLSLHIEPARARYWYCPPREFLDEVLSAPRAALRGLQDFKLEVPKCDYWDFESTEAKMREIVCKAA